MPVCSSLLRIEVAVSVRGAMAFPDVRRRILLRRAIPMRRKKTVGGRLRQRGGRFPGMMKRSRRRRCRKQHGRGFLLPYELVEQFI